MFLVTNYIILKLIYSLYNNIKNYFYFPPHLNIKNLILLTKKKIQLK